MIFVLATDMEQELEKMKSLFPSTLRPGSNCTRLGHFIFNLEKAGKGFQFRESRERSPKVDSAYLKGVGVWVNLIVAFISLCIFCSEFL